MPRGRSDFRPDLAAAPIDCGTATTILPRIVSAGLRRHSWSSVAETEVASGCLLASIDGFDEEFLDAEELASLKLELAALKEEA